MNKEEITLEILEIYKKEHKKNWLEFMKGMLWGYMHSVPEYKEARVSDFEEWLINRLDSQTKQEEV